MSQNRHCYLIDTENAGYGWINRLPPLNRSDRVVLFYSNNSLRDKSLALAESGGILEQMSLYRCENGGKNAMDYHILFWVAQESCLAPETKYAIVSNDADYDIALAPFLKHGIIISRMSIEKSGTATSEKTANVASIASKKASQTPQKPTPVSQSMNVPTKAKKLLSSMIKDKYLEGENLTLAYAAVLSGDKARMKKTIIQITDGKMKGDDLSRRVKTWLNYVDCMRRAAGIDA